jgi:hypothetical protein
LLKAEQANIFEGVCPNCLQSSKNAGLSFINMYEGVKEIGRLSLPSRTVMGR